MLRSLGILACACLVLAACGSGRHAAAPSPARTQCHAAKTAAALARLRTDIAALRAAARLPGADTLKGSPAVNAATDRFLRDVALAPIANLQRNRLIDHAAGALAGACEQCFQALEAARPIVNIRRGEERC